MNKLNHFHHDILYFQFHEAWRKLTDWLEEAEKRLDSELEISNEPDKIKVQLTKHKVLHCLQCVKQTNNVCFSIKITHFLFSFSLSGVPESVGVKAAGL